MVSFMQAEPVVLIHSFIYQSHRNKHHNDQNYSHWRHQVCQSSISDMYEGVSSLPSASELYEVGISSMQFVNHLKEYTV